jgi:hypothetical protein
MPPCKFETFFIIAVLRSKISVPSSLSLKSWHRVCPLALRFFHSESSISVTVAFVCGSVSITKTFFRRTFSQPSAINSASATVSEVFPTPPFKFIMLITFAIMFPFVSATRNNKLPLVFDSQAQSQYTPMPSINGVFRASQLIFSHKKQIWKNKIVPERAANAVRDRADLPVKAT